MIRIVLLGRTGNNLFQYALGRLLAEKHDAPLVLDGSWFNSAGWAQVSHFLKLPLRATVVRRCSLASRALRKFTGRHYWDYRGVPVLRESTEDQSFDPRFLNAPADCMLFGYFQSPLYFEKIAASLRAELNDLLAGSVRLPETIVRKLEAPNSVAVHVRRGDYLTHPVFQVCGHSYYQEAIRQMRMLVPDPRFFIFSDEPEWCRKEFRDTDQEVVDSGPAAANPLHDLRLMSLASHQIIANSTYSWWSAWLGERTGQRVILPDRWHASGESVPISEKRLSHWTIVS